MGLTKQTKIYLGIGLGAVAIVAITLLAVFLTPAALNDDDSATKPNTISPPDADVATRGDQFLSNFLFGCSSAAYQIEGGWNADGKGESIWDRMTHSDPATIDDRSNGDVAANSYALYADDVKALRQIGARVYRFSISWTRVLPDGDISSLNEAGLWYYDRLIDELLANGIEPMVTMYHFDLPQRLQELGGWANRYVIAYFEQYARVLYDRYADRVKYWITFNEPSMLCALGYAADQAPRFWSPGVGAYLCAHHVLLAHAHAYHLYRRHYRQQHGGKVSIALHARFAWAKDANKQADAQAAERSMQFELGMYANPIYSRDGDYPALVRRTVDANSKAANLWKSRLPVFSGEEVEMLRGSSDFMAVNYYTSSLVEPGRTADWPEPSMMRDANVLVSAADEWPASKSPWLRSVPTGLTAMLNWIREAYDNPEVIITETGWSDSGELDDRGRIAYMRGHLQAVLDANKHGSRVMGFLQRSLIDSFEWNAGYTVKFGLFRVDFDAKAAERTRTPKRSVAVLQEIIRTGRIGTELPPMPDDSNAFPADFLFGCSSAAYQIEGGWQADGKGESIWDRMAHTHPERFVNGTTGDVAANSYELYAEDVRALRQMGVQFYRFSVSWTRIMPDGEAASLNEAGLRYYDRLIDALLEAGIRPMITMYHWDLPQRLQELGGWTSAYVVDYFEDYARVLYDRYAPRVDLWVTFNEPLEFCWQGYGGGHAPRAQSPGVGVYLCHHHVLLAHARAYRLYERSYRSRFGGRVGISLNTDYSWPKDAAKAADVEAAERSVQFRLGIYAHTIFSAAGDYPATVRKRVDENSRRENVTSRLPRFTAAEVEALRGSADFLGLNYFTATYAEDGLDAGGSGLVPERSFASDMHVRQSHSESWPRGKAAWQVMVPQGLTDLLGWIRREYTNPEVIVTENGWSDEGQLNDVGRVEYLRGHLQAVLEARRQGSKVTGYAHWSVIDNIEWTMGYSERFGLYHIDFTSPAKTRTPKRSARLYRNIITTRRIPGATPAAPVELRFPSSFRFGSATAAYQIEGAWQADGKGESIWDRLAHQQPSRIRDNSTGDVAADSYRKYDADVQALRAVGSQFYRFSVGWPRVMPDGDVSSLNEAGLQYYDDLIDELLANGIEPMITMYHFDLPQRLQELGGWANVYMVDYFEQYARVLFRRYGDRVRQWMTFNEPAHFCASGYSAGHAPRLWSPGVGTYLCGHHVLLAHARAYRLYGAEFRSRQNGRIGIALGTEHTWPRNPSNAADVRAADRVYQFGLGWFAHPLFSAAGDYPAVMRERVAAVSGREGHTVSRLPAFTADEVVSLRGAADFLGLNYYTSAMAEDVGVQSEYERVSESRERDRNVRLWWDARWPVAASPWLHSVPEGLRELLRWVRDAYGNPEVMITENGWSDRGELNDTERVEYLTGHLQAVLEANVVDGCNVTGYTYWSIIDNFEWLEGYTERFGLYHVDYSSANKTRTPKLSAGVFRQIVESKQIPYMLDV